jgi:hypothetical protein
MRNRTFGLYLAANDRMLVSPMRPKPVAAVQPFIHAAGARAWDAASPRRVHWPDALLQRALPSRGLPSKGRVCNVVDLGALGWALRRQRSSSEARACALPLVDLSCRARRVAATLASMPKGVCFSEAASVPTVFVTVHLALRHASRCDRVLVHAAAGGVGLAAMQARPRAN